MFKSIFAKYITALTAIIVLSFAILSLAISAIVGDYSKNEYRMAVEHTSSHAAQIILHGYTADASLTLRDIIAAHPDFAKAMETLCLGDSSRLFVIDDENDLLHVSDGFEEDARHILADAAYFKPVLQKIRANEPYKSEDKIETLGQHDFFVCAVPLQDPNGNYIGAVYAAVSGEATGQVSVVTTQTVVMTCLWVMLAMLIATYFITERHVDPIRRMSQVAHGYATGNFEERVEAVGGDEIAELATAFNSMAAEMENLEKKRNRFISDVSHELRSPMTSVLGFVEAVADGSCPKEKEKYYLTLAAEEIKRLSRLVADLLDVSRLEMGESKMNFAKYDICDNAATVLISLEQRINEKKLDVSFETDKDRIFVLADSDAMYRVLYNLIENAVKFSREGGKLSISFKTDENTVQMRVFNEGVGISAEDLPSIFERFYKSDKSRGQDKKGVGLGLYFVKTILAAHNAEIRAESVEGEMCLFVVDIPLYRA